MLLHDSVAVMETDCAVSIQVGLMRRGRYVKGKRVGKGNLVSDVSTSF